FINPQNLSWPGWPGSKALGDSVILLIFAFVGIEVALIPSGEVKNPARTVPRSAYLALVITTIIYILIQLVAQGTLGINLANHKDAPLAEAAARFLGDSGRIVLLCCAACWFLVQRDVRAGGAQPFNFPGMKIVPALAIAAIIWILTHATAWEFEVNGIVLAVASVFYFLRAKLRAT